MRRIAGVILALVVSWLGQPTVGAGASPPTPVVVIVMENHSFGPDDIGVAGSTIKYIVGNPDAPYINNTLIPSGTLFSNYHAMEPDSLPNYLDMVAGSYGSCADDSCPPDSDPIDNMFHLMGQAGVSFDSFEQSMPSNCYLAFSVPYNIHHNPEIYLSDVDRNAALPYGCDVTDVPAPASWPTVLPQFSLITPDVCHDMHGTDKTGSCPHATDQIIKDGDAWLSQNVPEFLSRGAIVVVTFDEGTGLDTSGGGGHVATVMVGPDVPQGATDATAYSHFSLLAGLENHFGLSPLLGGAATATPLPIPQSAPSGVVITDFSPTSGMVGDSVSIRGSGFTGASSVTFAGTPAVFSVVSDTSISATVPAGATSGPISVTAPGGSATSSGSFTVNPSNPAPSLVQHVLSSGKSGTAPSANWTQPTQAGNLLVATVGWTGAGTLVPPAGWSLAAKVGGTAIFYEQDASAGSGSVSFSGSNLGAWVMNLTEWNGCATTGVLDSHATDTSGASASTTADSGTTAATSQPTEVAVAAIRTLKAVSQSNPTNSYALVDFGKQGTTALGTYAKVLSASAPQGVSVTLSASAKWRGAIATFRGG